MINTKLQGDLLPDSVDDTPKTHAVERLSRRFRAPVLEDDVCAPVIGQAEDFVVPGGRGEVVDAVVCTERAGSSEFCV